MTDLLPCVELETAPEPRASIIVLHGLGADGNDLVPIVDELELGESIPIRFIFPHAPVQRVSINGGYPMRAWYDIAEADLSRRADLAGVRRARAAVDRLIEREKERGVPAGRLMLAGFSQGGAIALYTGLRHPERLAGIIALSTYLIDGASLPQEASAANADVPIFMAHGSDDPIVRREWGETSRRMLHENGYRVDWHVYRMGHAVVPEEVRAIAMYVKQSLRMPRRVAN